MNDIYLFSSKLVNTSDLIIRVDPTEIDNTGKVIEHTLYEKLGYKF